ncbi:MAG: preprotein translocase subunit YajC [Candidatus Omnitrophica bacterium]|nr:preprotein translocase subunit YajC [Candidatus Omnitrophota bacterium]
MNPSPILNLVPMVLIIGVMYFLLIRPQVRQQKETARMQTNLKKNDNVVTVGGLHGVVVNLKDGVVTLRVDDNARVDVDRTAIARLAKEG